MHFSDGDKQLENVRSDISHTHSWPPCSDFQTKFISKWALYPLDVLNVHVEDIQRVFRCTTAPSVALNWSSRPSKQRKLCSPSSAYLQLQVFSSPGACDARNSYAKSSPEVDKGECQAPLDTVSRL